MRREAYVSNVLGKTFIIAQYPDWSEQCTAFSVCWATVHQGKTYAISQFGEHLSSARFSKNLIIDEDGVIILTGEIIYVHDPEWIRSHLEEFLLEELL